MDKNIYELEDNEVEPAVSRFSLLLEENPESISDESKFSDADLINVATLIHYLERSEILPNAQEVYSPLYKSVLMELSRRMGNLPYL